MSGRVNRSIFSFTKNDPTTNGRQLSLLLTIDMLELFHSMRKPQIFLKI